MSRMPRFTSAGAQFLLLAALLAWLCDASKTAAADPAPTFVRRFEGNKDFVYCAEFTPDGKLVLSGGGGELHLRRDTGYRPFASRFREGGKSKLDSYASFRRRSSNPPGRQRPFEQRPAFSSKR